MSPFYRLTSLRSRHQANNWRQLLHGVESQSVYSTANDSYQLDQSSRRKICFCSRRLLLSIVITLFILIAQLFLVHYHVGLNIGKVFRSQQSKTHDLDRLLESSSHKWLCHGLPQLAHISKIARKFGVDLAIVDPDLLNLLLAERSPKAVDSDDEPVIVFSGETNTRISQEPDRKSIIHLAAINETSGGQPNLRSFCNSLKHFGYTSLIYDDASQTMPAEIYRRQANQLDDGHSDAIKDQIKSKLGGESLLLQSKNQDALENEIVSKIYTEFISHLFILNRTLQAANKLDELSEASGKPFACQGGDALIVDPPVIHIFILYNYEYKPDEQWIQSSLALSEQDKHKLLRRRVHANDFRIPIQNYYIHPKRTLRTLEDTLAQLHEAELLNNKPSGLVAKIKDYTILEGFDGQLNFHNNTYINCAQSQFSISGLLDNTRQMSNYLKLLDTAKPLESGHKLDLIVDNQLSVAFKFMDDFLSSHGSVSYWLTGSTLLAYHKFCKLAIMPSNVQFDLIKSEEDEEENSSGNSNGEQVQAIGNLIINLELGFFASEFNQSMLNNLAALKSNGVTMISDWRKQQNSYLSFHLADCPNIIFNLYAYELRSDFYQYYYITQSSMIMSHKFKKKTRRKQKTQPETSNKNSLSTSEGAHHHVFATHNLDLCWTRTDYFHPFRVPCAVHDHLRRIFVI